MTTHPIATVDAFKTFENIFGSIEFHSWRTTVPLAATAARRGLGRTPMLHWTADSHE
jgi:hypothetical protein